MSSGLYPLLTSRKAVWRGFVVRAVVALSMVLAWPICDVYELHSAAASQSAPLAAAEHVAGETAHHSDESGTWCGSVDQAILAASAIPVLSAAKALFVVPAVSAARWTLAAGRAASVGPPEPSPRSLPYHARSARILV